MQTPASYRIYSCGDHAVTIELGDEIDAAVNQKIIALFQYLAGKKNEGVKDIIPAYNTLTLVYDIILLKKKDQNISAYDMMCTLLQKAVAAIDVTTAQLSRMIKIPVCYDTSLAPDIESLATLHSLTTEEVIQIHTGKTYRVYMIGFLPGFAYMGMVDEKIITPRRSDPRRSVPAGSIGIAGAQTGIYPFDSPGGWQLIGQTPVAMFAAENEDPCYLQPGDEVQFYSITAAEFKKIKQA